MPIPNDTRQRDQAAYIENPDDVGVDRRVNDVSGNIKLDDIISKTTGYDHEIPTIVEYSGHALDGFGNLKVTNATELWSFSHRYGDDVPRYWDTFSSSGGSTFVVDVDKAAMFVSGTLGAGDITDYRSYRYFEYLKGREQGFKFTLNPHGKVTDVIKRFGCFDDKNGLLFELEGQTARFVIRSCTSGATVNTNIDQADWNHDKLDGTGESGITIDWAKFNLFYIDYTWLGTNKVEFGIYSGGFKIPCHRYSPSNTFLSAYMQSGNLPICFNIVNQAAVGVAPIMHIGCMSVTSGGQSDKFGQVFVVDTGTAEVTVGTTPVIVAAIRMQTLKNRASLKPISFNLLSSSGNSTIYYRIQIDTILVGDVWAPISGSLAEGLTSYTSFSNGIIIQSGYLKAGGNTDIGEIISDLYVGRYITGMSQVLSIVCETVSSTSKLLFSGVYEEFK